MLSQRSVRRSDVLAETVSPSWLETIKTTRRVRVVPGALAPAAVATGAGAVCLAVGGYGLVRLDAAWGLLAVVATIALIVITLRGFPLLALLTVLVAVVSWGLLMRAWLPASWTAPLEVLRFVGGMLAFVVPVLACYLAVAALDGRRLARAAVDASVSGQRWWGESPEHLAQLLALEAIPAARFFALGEGACSHLVVAGRRVALILPTVWPRGDYEMSPGGQVLRGGRPFTPGVDDIGGLADAVRTWRERLTGTEAACRGFVVVSPPRDGVGGGVRVDVPPGERLHVLTADAFVETAGAWLAGEPYRVDLAVMRRLLTAASAAPAARAAPAAGAASSDDDAHADDAHADDAPANDAHENDAPDVDGHDVDGHDYDDPPEAVAEPTGSARPAGSRSRPLASLWSAAEAEFAAERTAVPEFLEGWKPVPGQRGGERPGQ